MRHQSVVGAGLCLVAIPAFGQLPPEIARFGEALELVERPVTIVNDQTTLKGWLVLPPASVRIRLSCSSMASTRDPGALVACRVIVMTLATRAA